MKHIFTLAALVFATPCFGQVPEYVSTDGLIAWYPLDGNGLDASQNQLDLNPDSNSPAPNRFGQGNSALKFEDSPVVSSHPQLNLTALNNFTISLWLQVDEVLPSFALIGNNLGSGENNKGQLMYGWGSEPESFAWHVNSSNSSGFGNFSSQVELAPDEWIHLVYIKNENEFQFYIDGIPMGLGQYEYAQPYTDNPTWIGGGNDCCNLGLIGQLDDVGIWNRALTAAEIAELYTAPPTPEGCMEVDACNYDPDAILDDGSCHFNCLFCNDGTIWNELTQGCDIANPSDTDFDGCVGMIDLLDLLSVFGTCNEISWSCGDPLEYQGYDYETVQIGEQCWFAENLRAESYQNGDSITSGLSNEEWSSATTGATAVYGHDHSYLDAYGRLYNFHVVEDNRSICPAMWHVPSDDEIIELENQLGMMPGEATAVGFRGGNIGDALKSTSGWNGDGNGTNVSGMNVVPSGNRYHHGAFLSLGENGSWWTSTQNQNDESKAWYRSLSHDDEGIYREHDALKTIGFPLRCIKDSE